MWKISPKFVPKGLIKNVPALVQIMAWCPPGAKPLCEPMMVNLPTHICITLPQWVNQHFCQSQEPWCFRVSKVLQISCWPFWMVMLYQVKVTWNNFLLRNFELKCVMGSQLYVLWITPYHLVIRSWNWDNVTASFQRNFQINNSYLKTVVFWCKFHQSLSSWIQLTLIQH